MEQVVAIINHSDCDLQEDLDALDLHGADPHGTSMTTLVHAFKRKSFLLMPGKHLGIANAHSRFEELNSSFLKVCKVKVIFYLNFILLAFGAQSHFERIRSSKCYSW